MKKTTKIDIFSGFLGAGKTTLIKKLIKEAYKNEKLVLIENEFGDIGIDGGFMQDAGIEVTEMNSGCICCSLVGDFSRSLEKVLTEYQPDRVLIEPSGVGKLSDVIKAVKSVNSENAVLNSSTTVVDGSKCKMYMKNFGEFFSDQIENASCIIISHTDKIGENKLDECLSIVRGSNKDAQIIATSLEQLDGTTILSAMEKTSSLTDELESMKKDCIHHHHHDHDCDCGCHEHEHHHHHEHECDCHEHHHHHEHECDCHEHHHHHADEVFSSWGVETMHSYSKENLENILICLSDEEKYGMVLRAKGIVRSDNGWLHFDYVPDESNVRIGSASTIGRLCVIGSNINSEEISKLFEV